MEQSETSMFPARWWKALDGGRVLCQLCPRDCQLQEGQRGACFVRQNAQGKMVLTTWGRSSGFCLDPIEKKPLYHFYPGSSVLSFGTAGCNLTCKFCQNHDISRSRDMDRLQSEARPEHIARAAHDQQALSVAYTYNDPVIFSEYALDVAAACRSVGVANVAVTAGYIYPEPRREFFALMDAANVDLKAYTDDFYHKLCSARLRPVLETIAWIYHETTCWLELTTLVIPGMNDSDDEISALSSWVARELGDDVPLHFSAFHPDWRMQDISCTPLSTLRRARQIALDHGLHYVYTGNVDDDLGGGTYCPQCTALLIARHGYEITHYGLGPGGDCSHCGATIHGRFGSYQGSFGNRRFQVNLVDYR